MLFGWIQVGIQSHSKDVDLVIILARTINLKAGAFQQFLEPFFGFGFSITFRCAKSFIAFIDLAQLQAFVWIFHLSQECIDKSKNAAGFIPEFLFGRFHHACFLECEAVIPKPIVPLHGPVEDPGELTGYFFKSSEAISDDPEFRSLSFFKLDLCFYRLVMPFY